MTALLALYLVVLGSRGLLLFKTGTPEGIGLGVAVVVIFGLGAWAVAREWWLAILTDRMAEQAERDGTLVIDDLPRSRGGRVDRDTADARFPLAQEAVEADPSNWAAWFNLAWAYDACGDRRRARAALRTAAKLFRSR